MAIHDLGRIAVASNRKTLNILVLAPHPDDLELSCGLLCHKAMTIGWNIHEIVMTDGTAGGIDPKLFHTNKLRQLRVVEAKKGGAHLGVDSIEFLGYEDARLAHYLQSATTTISQRLKSLYPAIVVFPSVYDTHMDHVITHKAAVKALKTYKKDIITLEYCFWGQDNRQNITLLHPAGIQAKEKAIRKHKTQPIEKYLHRLYESNKVTNGYERYYNPNSNKTIQVMSQLGFCIKKTIGVWV